MLVYALLWRRAYRLRSSLRFAANQASVLASLKDEALELFADAWPFGRCILQRIKRWCTPWVARLGCHNRGSTGRADLSTNVRTDDGASRGLGWGTPPLSFLSGLPLANGLRAVVVPRNICAEHVGEKWGFASGPRAGGWIFYASEIHEPGAKRGGIANIHQLLGVADRRISGAQEKYHAASGLRNELKCRHPLR